MKTGVQMERSRIERALTAQRALTPLEIERERLRLARAEGDLVRRRLVTRARHVGLRIYPVPKELR